MSTQANYLKAMERRTQVESQLARIKAELNKLQANQVKLVSRVLLSSHVIPSPERPFAHFVLRLRSRRFSVSVSV